LFKDAQLGSEQVGGRVVAFGLAALQEEPDGGLAIGEPAWVIGHPAQSGLMDAIRRPTITDGDEVDFLNGDVQSHRSQLIVDLLHFRQHGRIAFALLRRSGGPGPGKNRHADQQRENCEDFQRDLCHKLFYLRKKSGCLGFGFYRFGVDQKGAGTKSDLRNTGDERNRTVSSGREQYRWSVGIVNEKWRRDSPRLAAETRP
jgi:hypothetical protein